MSAPLQKTLPRWLICVLALTLPAILIGGIVFYRYQGQQQLRYVAAELTAIATLKAAQISEWRRDQLFDAEAFRKDPFLNQSAARLLAHPSEENARDLRIRLSNIAVQHDYDDIILVDPAGKVLLSLSGIFNNCKEVSVALASAVKERKPVFADFHLGGKNSDPHLSWVAPLFSGQGPVFGALILVNDAETALYSSIQTWPIPSQTSEALLVRRDGDHALYLNELRHRKGAALKLRVPIAGTDRLASAAAQGQEGFVRGRDYRAVEAAAVIAHIPDSPWLLIVKMDAEEAFAEGQFRSAMILTVIGLLIGAACLSGLAVWQLEKKRHYQTLFQSESLRRADAERHRITLQSIGDAVISTDETGRVTMMNPAAESLSGWRNADAIGKPIDEVFRILHEETGETIESPVARVLRDGKPVSLANHTLLIAKDGNRRPIADSGAPIRSEDGNIIGVVLVFRDQTAERASLKALRESQSRIRATLDQMMEGCQIIGPDGRFVYVNHAAEIHSRHSREELTGRMPEEVWPEIRNTELFAQIQRCLKEQTIGRLEHRVSLPDGSQQWFDMRIQPAPDGVMLLSQDITQRKQAESLRRQLFDIIEKSLNEIFIFDPQTLRFLHVNQGALANLQYSLEEIRKRTPLDLKPEFTEASFRSMIEPLLANRQESLVFETVHRRADGSLYPVEVHLQLIEAESGPVFLAVIFDITKRKLTEAEREQLLAQLIQAQKMESIGRLAGGIAHDFNNLLSIILGYGEIILDQMRMDHPYRQPIQEIQAAAIRAKDLTRQLLAFSRKQLLEFSLVDVNEVVTRFERMLNRLLGEDIELKLLTSEEPLYVSGDAAQLEQVLMNLAVNARDAMADGGTLTIETGRVSPDAVGADKTPELAPMDYARIVFRDTGCGMDADTLSHVFEPFFTTKDKEKGTGLGLATSYGIIQQHGGSIQVESELNRGTTFRIYLPINAEAAAVQAQPVQMREATGFSKTILLVEDDVSLRKLAIVILQRGGYDVIESESVDDAVRKASEYRSPIHLVLTDVVMPKMKGPEVFSKITAYHPETKVLFMSGYSDDIIARQGVLQKGIHFIQKPFTVEALLDKVDQVLNQ
jgi:PAS domain S-box-containing protein